MIASAGLLLTGADARWLAARLGSGSGLVVDNLVLDGLRLIDSISA